MPSSRQRTEFRLAILMPFAAVAALGVLPFAVYRFAAGQLLAGAVDLALVLCIGAAAGYTWRGQPARASLLLVVVSGVACALMVPLVGLAAVLWTYPVLLANYLLAGRGPAVLASMLEIATIAALGYRYGPLASAASVAMFVTTALVVNLFAFIFAQRTEQQRRHLERVASHDALTGAYNRRAMASELPIALAYARRHRQPVALALLDLDHFKRVNDRDGHEFGDMVLVNLVRLVESAIRGGDRLFRYGGEEFVLLLPGADEAAMRLRCEDLRGRVARTLRAGGGPVTVSIGVAVARDGEDVAAWLARADDALYRAKQAGRDRVLVAEANQTPRRAGEDRAQPEPTQA